MSFNFLMYAVLFVTYCPRDLGLLFACRLLLNHCFTLLSSDLARAWEFSSFREHLYVFQSWVLSMSSSSQEQTLTLTVRFLCFQVILMM